MKGVAVHIKAIVCAVLSAWCACTFSEESKVLPAVQTRDSSDRESGKGYVFWRPIAPAKWFDRRPSWAQNAR